LILSPVGVADALVSASLRLRLNSAARVRRAEAPAEAAGGRQPVEGIGLLAWAMLLDQRVFVEQHGVLADAFADQAAQIGEVDLVAGRHGGGLRQPLLALAIELGGAGPPRGDARFGH